MAEFQKFLISRARAGQSYADVIRALSDEDMAIFVRITEDPSLDWCTDENALIAGCIGEDGDIVLPDEGACAACTERFLKRVPVA